jgi:aryl-alcohol dehydrogenase-like predicted oxidoreductase
VTQSGIDIGKKLSDLAQAHGLEPGQLAILWVKDQPGITAPIFGPRTIDQLDRILPVLKMELSDELRAACDTLVPPGSAVTNFHNGCTWMKQQLLGV